MIQFLLAGDNIPFSIAISLMIAIGILELAFSLFGAGLSSLIEAGLPDMSPDASVDATGFEEATPLSRLLGWLRVGQVPLLVLFVVLLTAFGLVGLAGQYVSQMVLGFLMPWPIAAAGAAAASVPCTRTVGGWLGRIIPRDETEAVSEETFVGRIAIITTGTARGGHPAEARLQDQFKQTHYISVEPDDSGDTFPPGTAVLLVKRQGPLFKAIRNTNSALVD